MASIGQRVIHHIRKTLFDRIRTLPLSFFDSHRHGELMSRLTNDVDNISTTISNSLTLLLTYIFTVSGIFLAMLYLSHTAKVWMRRKPAPTGGKSIQALFSGPLSASRACPASPSCSPASQQPSRVPAAISRSDFPAAHSRFCQLHQCAGCQDRSGSAERTAAHDRQHDRAAGEPADFHGDADGSHSVPGQRLYKRLRNA